MGTNAVYVIGDQTLRSVAFTDPSGAAADPTAVIYTARKPDGTTLELSGGSVIHDGTGAYHVVVTVDQAGDWAEKFVGSGDVVQTRQGWFYVSPDVTASDPAGRDLCTLRDVFRLVPGFDPDDVDNADIVETCANLISSESVSVIRETGREIVEIPDNNPRTFDLTHSICARRSLPIGDAAAVTQIELFDYDGTTSLGIIDPGLYILLPRLRQSWEPLTRVRFPYRPASPPPLLAPGRTLAITGTWGFPQIPFDLRQACAKRVLLRYIADTANAGTRLADAIDDTFNIGALLASARDTVDGYSRPGFA